MKEPLANLRFSRTLAAVVLANLSSLVILNTLRLRPAHMLIAYPLAFAIFFILLQRARVRRAKLAVPRWAIVSGWLYAGFLTVPRLPYFLEWIPGNAVLVQADDWGRIAELISMTLSERYPLEHFANQGYLLSHYYTAFYPAALWKSLVPFLTLKDCIALGNTIYHPLLVMSFLEISTRLFTRPASLRALLFLVSLFGGFDWLFHWNLLMSHAEPWQREVLNGLREISSYFTGVYWVVHHFLAFYALVLAYVLHNSLRFSSRRLKILVMGLLVISAIYSGIFAVLPVLLIGFPELWRLARGSWRTRVAPVHLAVLFAPAFLFAGRVQSGSFFISPLAIWPASSPVLEVITSLPVYLAATSVVDLVGIPVVLWFCYRSFAKRERRFFLGAWGFYISTYFVESIGWNNYCMRGMFLPTFVFFYLFAKHAWPAIERRVLLLSRGRVVAVLVVVFLSVGTVREWMYLVYQPLMHSYSYWELRGREVPERIAVQLRKQYRNLARDPATRYYTPDVGDRDSPNKYNAEKMISGVPLDQMLEPELEVLRRPLRGWLW